MTGRSSSPAEQQERARVAQALLHRASNPELVDIDIRRVGEYVREDLFQRTVFLWDKNQLEIDGALYNDYMNNCQAKIADGALLNVGNREAKNYMNLVWVTMTKRDLYAKWLGAKRTNSYQSMRDKFMSK